MYSHVTRDDMCAALRYPADTLADEGVGLHQGRKSTDK